MRANRPKRRIMTTPCCEVLDLPGVTLAGARQYQVIIRCAFVKGSPAVPSGDGTHQHRVAARVASTLTFT
jgi:hypothetical protein